MATELPSAFLAELRDFFGERLVNGVFVDPAFGRHLAERLDDAQQRVAELEAAGFALLELRRNGGLPDPDGGPGARTPAQRRAVAQSATPLDPDGRVIAFPVARQPRPVVDDGLFEGGAA